jgi:hypothetical protein
MPNRVGLVFVALALAAAVSWVTIGRGLGGALPDAGPSLGPSASALPASSISPPASPWDRV